MAAKKLRPVHPGDILRNDFLEPFGLTAYRLAKELGVSRPTVNQLVARRRSVTAEMALRLARYFGTSAQVWQNLQAQYDLEVATTKIGKTVNQKIRPRSTADGVAGAAIPGESWRRWGGGTAMP